jgi:multiple sugar transport system permease protein
MSTEQATAEQRQSGVLSGITRWMENLTETQFAYLLLTPVFVLLGAIALWPLLKTFEFSLFSDSLIGASRIGEFVGLQNYVELWTGQKDDILPGTTSFINFSAPFQSALIVTVVFTVVSVFFETIIGFAQALILDQDFRGRRWVRVAIIIPWAVPIVIQGMIFFLMFRSGVGFATAPLQDLGLIAQTQPLNDPASSLLIIIVADVWKTSAFMALLILAGLQSIDRGLYDVARVAGASRVQQFRLITLPLILPTIGVAMLFRTVAAMRVYGIIDTVSKCEVVPSLSCMVVATYQTRYGTSGAIAFSTALIIGLFVSVIIYQQAKEGF